MKNKKHWRTSKQTEQFIPGSSITTKANHYIGAWKERCYEDLPDEVPRLLEKSGRAPSYRALALAILKNNMALVGFASMDNRLSLDIKAEAKEHCSPQMRLIFCGWSK